MGKSNKKVKSERINALKKQYDSFLEEDKKRRERNEYILGKLDKMAYSTALIPARQKPFQAPINRPSPMYQLVYRPQFPSSPLPVHKPAISHQLKPDYPGHQINDSNIIQEISKHYILIPKLRPSFTNNDIHDIGPIQKARIVQDFNEPQNNNSNGNNVQLNAADNTDWKSKYEILNILKKEEKEEPKMKFVEPKQENALNKQTISNNTYDKVGADTISNIFTDTNYKYINELPEKDGNAQKLNNQPEMVEKVNDVAIIQSAPISSTNTVAVNEILPVTVDAVADIDYKLQNTNLEYNYMEPNTDPTAELVAHEAINNTENNYTESTAEFIDDKQPSEQLHYEEHLETQGDVNAMIQDYPAEPTNTVFTNQEQNEHSGDHMYDPEVLAEQYQSGYSDNNVYLEEPGANTTTAINPEEYVQEINNSQLVPDTETAEYMQYETENTNIQVPTSKVEMQMKNSTDMKPEQRMMEHTDEELTDQTFDHGVQPEVAPEIKEEDIANDESADVAGIQAFDAEQREMFYSEQPAVPDDYGYQQGDINVNEQGYQQNEMYPENQEYYEGTLPQTYPVDIGEGEEQTLAYDQSYQQQYENSYEKVYNQPQPQEYEQPETYQHIQPQEMEELYNQQAYESVDQVQTALDNEDGYVEQIPQVPDTQNDEVEKGELKQIDPASQASVVS